MKTMTQVVCFLGLAVAATPVAAGSQFADTCEGSYCFQSFIEKVSPTGAGLFKVKTRNVGFDSATKEKSVDYRWAVVSCDKADPYVSAGRERITVDSDIIAGPLKGGHVAQEADRLWKAVCERKN